MLYSIFYFFPKEEDLTEALLGDMVQHYVQGTKLYLVCTFTPLSFIDAIDNHLAQKQLQRHGETFRPLDESGTKDLYYFFHCSIHFLAEEWDVPFFFIENGDSASYSNILHEISQKTSFNFAQYKGEHSSPHQNIFLEGEAGTGKTRALVARLFFLWYHSEVSFTQFCQSVEFVFTTKELTTYFTSLVEQQWRDLYLLTGEQRYREELSLPVYASLDYFLLKLNQERIPLLLWEDDTALQEIIYSYVESHLIIPPDMPSLVEQTQVSYREIQNCLHGLILGLYQKHIDVTCLTAENFGDVPTEDGMWVIREFYHDCIASIAKKWEEILEKQGLIHPCQVLVRYLRRENVGSTAPSLGTYLFIDDLDALSSGELDAIVSVVQQEERIIFLTRNEVRQGGYPSHEEHIQNLLANSNRCLWSFIKLERNYRIDQYLNAILRKAYHLQEQSVDFHCNYNQYLLKYWTKFYHSETTPSPSLDMLYQEVLRCQRRLEYEENQGHSFAFRRKTIAILCETTAQRDKIVAYFRNTPLVLQNTGTMPSPALAELRLLLRTMLYPSHDLNWYHLAKSNFFGLVPSKARLLRQRYQEDSSVLREDIQGQFQFLAREVEGYSFSQFEEALFHSPLLEVLDLFYNITKPWVKYSSFFEKQKQYRQDIEGIFALLEEKSLHTLTQAYEFLRRMPSGGFALSPPLPLLEEEGIYCMTVGQARGLTFGQVLVPYEYEGNPSSTRVIYGKLPQISYVFPTELNQQVFSKGEQSHGERARYTYDMSTRGEYGFSYFRGRDH